MQINHFDIYRYMVTLPVASMYGTFTYIYHYLPTLTMEINQM